MMHRPYGRFFSLVFIILLLCSCILSGCTTAQPEYISGKRIASPTNRSTKQEEARADPQTAANVLAFLSDDPEVGKLYCPRLGTDFSGIYIGRFFNFDIVLEQTGQCMTTVRKIGTERFRHTGGFILWASKNGFVQKLESAYKTGCLSDPQLIIISNAFAEIESQWTHPTVDAGDPVTLSAKERLLLNDALQTRCNGDIFGPDGNLADPRMRFYGKFENIGDPEFSDSSFGTYYVLFSQKEISLEVHTYLTVGGSFFYHPDGFSILLVTDSGEVMTVREAYEAGYLLRQDVATLARIHKSVEIEVGRYEENGWDYPTFVIQ